MTKVINRKTGLVLKMDCCISYFLQTADSAGIDINEDMASIDYTKGVIEFEGKDDTFINILKGKL